MSTRDHWNDVYATRAVDRLGWYEAEPAMSLQLIARCALGSDDPILDVGAGATRLIDFLVDQGHRRIVALDISEVALQRLRARLDPEKAAAVEWVVGDITDPGLVAALPDVALWHDRAALHFLVAEGQRQAYVTALRKAVKVGGHVVIAAFAKDGATHCSGLEVRRYDGNELVALLGTDFALQESLDYVYQMPSGAFRPYLYARFRRVG